MLQPCRIEAAADLDTPVHYADVKCRGTESSLRECPSEALASNTSHDSDVYIVCLPGTESYSGSSCDTHMTDLSFTLLYRSSHVALWHSPRGRLETGGEHC